MSYKILSKFIKDISFEIPNVQAFAMLENEISKYNLTFDIKSAPFKKNIIEVNTILKILPGDNVKYKILAEINYAALVSIENELADKEKLKKIILVDVPTDIYPTLYETFVYVFKQAGVNTVNITKEVDFEKLYNDKNKS
jgi:preprotein translocase subunit SecB|tara:strand:+ start:466 stop:885 length:420 start_codon:yes stop_codon:yes gene_type:complete